MSSRRFDREGDFAVGCPQVLFGLRAVSSHVVIIRGPGFVHFPLRFVNVVTRLIEVVPITDGSGKRGSKDKRQTQSGNRNRFLHGHSYQDTLTSNGAVIGNQFYARQARQR